VNLGLEVTSIQSKAVAGFAKARLNLVQIVQDEVERRPVLVAEDNGAVVAIALVSYAETYATIEDIIVSPSGVGIGKEIMDWIATEALSPGIHRIFLESGINNERAHRFFEREGFHATSVVMMRFLK